MKNGNLATKLAMAAILLTVLIYFGVSVALYIMDMDPYTTSVAYAFTCDDAVTVTGYVVRDEEVLAGSGDLVYSPRSEGERVSAGGTVALIYQTSQALSDANVLRGLEEQLDQLNSARNLAGASQIRPDEETAEALLSFRKELAAGVDGALEEAGTLRAAVIKRAYAYSGTGDLDASIASLQTQIAGLAASADPSTTRIAAPKAGLFSSLVDGYEGILNLDMVSGLTPRTYAAIAPAPSAGGVGKMVYGRKWAFVCTMRQEDMHDMAEGDTLTLRFQKGLNRDMQVKVSSISVEEGGEHVVVFTSEKFLNLTTLLRYQSAQVIFHSYTGIRVPRSTVRVEARPMTDEDGEPVLDSKGNPRTRPVTGVYGLYGPYARFKPVTVLWQEDEYILVEPDSDYLASITVEGAREGRRLRAGELVITAAADLFDGKVIR